MPESCREGAPSLRADSVAGRLGPGRAGASTNPPDVKGVPAMGPEEHRRVVYLSAGIGLGGLIGVLAGDTPLWVPFAAAATAYALGWVTYAFRRRLRPPPR
jgi:hypothetical protein